MRAYLVISFLLLFSTISFSQSGWFWQNPLPQGNDLYCVKYVSSNTAFAGGACGTVLKTTDNGLNWNITRTDSGFINTSIYFQNINTGYVLSSTDLSHAYYFRECKILKTTNGGNTWTSKSILSSGYTCSLEFTSQNTGYFTSKDLNNTGYIYKTTDGGENWFLILSQSNKFIVNTHFFNNAMGFACGNIGISKTTDGGATWQNKVAFSGYPGSIINSIKFLNASTGIAVGIYVYFMGSSQLILKTTNGGENWANVTGFGNNELSNISILNENKILSLGSSTLIQTTNFGNNWSGITLNGNSYLKSFDFSSQNGMIVGYYGNIVNSSDYGENWTNFFLSSGVSYTGTIRFANKNIGYVTSNKKILKTTNKGVNWITLNTPSNKDLISLSVIDSNIIYAGGGNSEGNSSIIKTTNGGINWEVRNSASTIYFLNSIYFLNKDTGFCCGSGVVSKTTNGGINWINNTSFANGALYCLYFVNDQTGYVSGYDNSYKTTNGGTSWTPLNIFGKSIYFINSDTGFTTGYNMQIKKTTNGGVSWVTKTQGVEWYMESIHFINSFTGFAAGDMGAILKTTDAGESWIRQKSLTNNFLYSVYMTDTNVCYVAGANNTILKTTTGGNPVIGITNLTNEIPKQFLLYQNYPNPFNPATKINFDISKQSFAKIIVFDLLGREVSVVVNEVLQPGSYSVSWNGSNYTSGIYFYSLEVNNYKETRKMVLLK